MVKRKVGFIKENIPTEDNLLIKKVIYLISLLTTRVTKENTRIPRGNKFVSIVFGSRNETRRAK